jgi:hypothetical protein
MLLRGEVVTPNDPNGGGFSETEVLKFWTATVSLFDMTTFDTGPDRHRLDAINALPIPSTSTTTSALDNRGVLGKQFRLRPAPRYLDDTPVSYLRTKGQRRSK